MIGGIIASSIVNVMKSKGPAYKPQDFMIDWEKELVDKQQPEQNMKSAVADIKALMSRKRRN